MREDRKAPTSPRRNGRRPKNATSCGGAAEKNRAGQRPGRPTSPKRARPARPPAGGPQGRGAANDTRAEAQARGRAARGRGPQPRSGGEPARTTEQQGRPRQRSDEERPRAAPLRARVHLGALPCKRRGRPEQDSTGLYACPRRPYGPTVTPPPQRQAASWRQWAAISRPVGPPRADNMTSRGSQHPHARYGRAGAVRRTGLRSLAPAAATSLAGSDVPANGSVWSAAEFATTVQASPTPRRIGGARGGRLRRWGAGRQPRERAGPSRRRRARERERFSRRAVMVGPGGGAETRRRREPRPAPRAVLVRPSFT